MKKKIELQIIFDDISLSCKGEKLLLSECIILKVLFKVNEFDVTLPDSDAVIVYILVWKGQSDDGWMSYWMNENCMISLLFFCAFNLYNLFCTVSYLLPNLDVH